MSKIKNGGLDQYGAGPFEQQQFGTDDVEGVYLFSDLWAKRLSHIDQLPSWRCVTQRGQRTVLYLVCRFKELGIRLPQVTCYIFKGN